MLRTSTSVALIASFACALGLSLEARAGTAIDLIWRQSGTPTADTASITGNITADVVLTTMAIPDDVRALSISFRFDADFKDELNFVNGGELSVVSLPGMGNTFTPLLPGFSSTTESDGTTVGLLRNFDQSAGLSTGAISVTRTLGSIVMSVNTANVESDGADLVPFIASDGIDGVINGMGTLLMPTIGGAAVNAPEPSSALVGSMALGSLLMMARRRRR